MASELKVNTITEATSGSGITFAKDVIPATPLSHRNVIINGGMQVWQRATAEVTISDGSNEGYQTVDRFKQTFGSACAGAVKWSRATEVPDLSGGDMFNHSLKVQTSSVNASPNTVKYASIDYVVEAHDMQRFGWGKTNKKDAVLSFYFKTSKTGVYSFYFQTPGTGTRRRTISFNVADTNWNRYSIALTADTVSIPDANTYGLLIQLNLINAPDYQNTSGTDSGWGTAIKLTDDGQVNFLDSNSNILYLTGMQLELGNVATPFEHRSYAEELRRCERYYHVITETNTNGKYIGSGWSYDNNYFTWTYYIPVVMRSAPDVKNSTGSGFYYNYHAGTGTDYTTVPAGTRTDRCVTFDFNSSGAYTAGRAGGMYIAHADAYIHLESEL